MKNSCTIFVDILLLIGVVYLFSCSNGSRNIYNDNNTTNADYNINHYIDTINGHIILTTVVDNSHLDLSVSTLELNNN